MIQRFLWQFAAGMIMLSAMLATGCAARRARVAAIEPTYSHLRPHDHLTLVTPESLSRLTPSASRGDGLQ